MSANLTELINSEEFENALESGATHKREISETFKNRNKTNFNSFCEIMLESDEEIKRILETKKSKRTDNDKTILETFKKNIRSMYMQFQDLTITENLDEGKKTKIEKIVDKIFPVIQILQYIGNDCLEKEFSKRGVTLKLDKTLEDQCSALASESKKECIRSILLDATAIKQQAYDGNIHLNETMFETMVPYELQYDKETNGSGLKTTDWRKLVDAKAKLTEAKSEEAKEKAEKKIHDMAVQKQFEAERANLVKDKLVNI